MNTLFVRSERVLLPDGVRPATVAIEDGRIAAILDWDSDGVGVEVEDAGHLLVLPGLVDTHVHVDDPGRADWEGFEHATKAAAAGGVTTIVDMPLNSVPATTDVDALRPSVTRRAAAAGSTSGAGEAWSRATSRHSNRSRRQACSASSVSCHRRGWRSSSTSAPTTFAAPCRSWRAPSSAAGARGAPRAPSPDRPGAQPSRSPPLRVWLESRPADAEQAAIDLLIELSRATGAHVHVVHLASADALPRITAARRSGVPITVETCPHYLTFAADEIRDGATPFKCAPPIRDSRHRDHLWDGLDRGSIDLIASDHSPAPPSLKHIDDGDFVAAWGGIASLQLGLRAVWTGAARRGYSMADVSRWTATAPARLAGLEACKGAIGRASTPTSCSSTMRTRRSSIRPRCIIDTRSPRMPECRLRGAVTTDLPPRRDGVPRRTMRRRGAGTACSGKQ